MSTTGARRPPTVTSLRLGLVADCGPGPGVPAAKPNDELAQQQFVNTIPAVVIEALFRNSLRVGMIDCQLHTNLDFRLALPDGLLIHRTPFRGNEVVPAD